MAGRLTTARLSSFILEITTRVDDVNAKQLASTEIQIQNEAAGDGADQIDAGEDFAIGDAVSIEKQAGIKLT